MKAHTLQLLSKPPGGASAAFRSILLLMIAVLFGIAASAAEYIWTGGGTNNYWSNSGNWTNSLVPTNDGSSIIIISGTNQTIYLDVEATNASITVNSNAGQLRIEGTNRLEFWGDFTNNSAYPVTLANDTILLKSVSKWAGDFLLTPNPEFSDGAQLKNYTADDYNGGGPVPWFTNWVIQGNITFSNYYTTNQVSERIEAWESYATPPLHEGPTSTSIFIDTSADYRVFGMYATNNNPIQFKNCIGYIAGNCGAANPPGCSLSGLHLDMTDLDVWVYVTDAVGNVTLTNYSTLFVRNAAVQTIGNIQADLGKIVFHNGTDGNQTVTNGDITLNNSRITMWSYNQDGENMPPVQAGKLTISATNTIQWTPPYGGGGSFNGIVTNSVLRFANSSTNSWSGAMFIYGWEQHGHSNQGFHLFFGTNSSGLTTNQLNLIKFDITDTNQMLIPAGLYGAKINSDGEVVPDN